MTPAPLAAVLDQLAASREYISQLDDRETGHFTAVSDRLTQLADLITTMGRALADETAGLDRQVSALAAQLASDRDTSRYEPTAAPSWWRLPFAERKEPTARLKAWVDQVYRPGYGHLAITLGPCWERHDLCLYGLDILSQLWRALYLQPRSTALLSAQAEYQARILPALAAQLMTETTGCDHDPGRRQSAPYTWSMS